MIRRLGFAQALASRWRDKTSDVYRLKPIGIGVDERPKGREKFPDDYAVHLEAEPVGVFHDRRPNEQPQSTQVRTTGEWRLHFESGKDIDSKDVVKVTDMDNRVFNIVGPLSGSDEAARIFEATEIV